MNNFFSASVLLGLYLSGVLADLPYRNFEVSPQGTPHYPMGTGTGDHHHHHPEGPLKTPPYPTNTEPHLGGLGGDEHVYTMKTMTRTRGPSGGFPPYGTGRPYPYPGKV
ncbi:hypothetical protein CHU98_g2138 [Xylaria longipes]|nr:hypothetical protein CHU98_g2138 [Xylaria longipes]